MIYTNHTPNAVGKYLVECTTNLHAESWVVTTKKEAMKLASGLRRMRGYAHRHIQVFRSEKPTKDDHPILIHDAYREMTPGVGFGPWVISP